MEAKTKTKSIFSGMGGLISALAGLVTVTLGILAIGSQVGWFDGGSNAKDGTEATTGEGAQTEQGATGSGSQGSSGGSSGAVSGSAKPSFALDPDAVDFALLSSKESEVTLKNTGTSPFSVQRPTATGSGASGFKVSDVDCLGSDVPAKGSCTVKVEFVATKAGSYSAILNIPIGGSTATASLKGEKLL